MFPDISTLTTVDPSCEKLDLNKLHQDIPKYYPFLQSASKLIWDNFLEQQLPKLTSKLPSTPHVDQFRQFIAAGASHHVISSVNEDPESDIPLDANHEEVSSNHSYFMLSYGGGGGLG